MIVEVRTYQVKPGLRDRFLEFFRRDAVPLQRSLGISVLGPFIDLENPDVFIWMRGFPSLEERERMRSALYDGEQWRNELRAIALPMLDSYSVSLTATTPEFADDFTARAAAAS